MEPTLNELVSSNLSSPANDPEGEIRGEELRQMTIVSSIHICASCYECHYHHHCSSNCSTDLFDFDIDCSKYHCEDQRQVEEEGGVLRSDSKVEEVQHGDACVQYRRNEDHVNEFVSKVRDDELPSGVVILCI